MNNRWIRLRGFLLWAIFVASLWLTLKSSNDELPNWLSGTTAGAWLLQCNTGNQTIHDVAVGVLVSLFIYFLVVWVPEHDKRSRVRQNLRLQFDSFKDECIRVFLSAMEGGYDPAVIDGLKDREQFIQFFEQPFSPGQTRWHAVGNGLDQRYINILVVEIEVFISEVRFAMMAVDVENKDVFIFLKNLANTLYRARNCSPDYDSVKSLLGLMWELFAQWNFIEGYIKRDVIADNIEAM